MQTNKYRTVGRLGHNPRATKRQYRNGTVFISKMFELLTYQCWGSKKIFSGFLSGSGHVNSCLHTNIYTKVPYILANPFHLNKLAFGSSMIITDPFRYGRYPGYLPYRYLQTTLESHGSGSTTLQRLTWRQGTADDLIQKTMLSKQKLYIRWYQHIRIIAVNLFEQNKG